MQPNTHKDAACDLEPLMTIKEMARVLKIHPSTLYKLTQKHAVPHARVGGGIRFRLSTVMAHLEDSHARK